MIDVKYLINFEEQVVKAFSQKKIRAPIHLSNGNEIALLKIFKKIKKNDWIFCSWRAHYQCLLKGVSRKQLLNEIIEGRSMSLSFLEKKIYSSSIVAGNLPIAVGTAIGLKMKKSKSKVFCFIGDMTSQTGIAFESITYSINHKLPIHFIIEDNQESVLTPTKKVWKTKKLFFEDFNKKYITVYKYKNKYPHAGTGTRIQF